VRIELGERLRAIRCRACSAAPPASTSPGGTSPARRCALLVVAGRVHVRLGPEIYDLGAGDSVRYRSSTAHGVSNPGDETAEVISAISPPSY
jgi:mannose-6-phosphate isomerase-like protein (cupin superfamily)